MTVKEFRVQLDSFPEYLQVKMCFETDYGGGSAVIFSDVSLAAVGGTTGATTLVISKKE